MIGWSDAQPRATLHVTRMPCAECDGPTPTLCKRHQGVDDWRPMVSRFVLSDVPRPDLIGQHIAIGSTDDDLGDWLHSDKASATLRQLKDWAGTLPLGHIVGSATVAACYPIYARNTTWRSRVIEHRDGRLKWYGALVTDIENISDQLPYGDWTPGRYALELVDAAPCTERCPWCWGDLLGPDCDTLQQFANGCRVCGGEDGRCDPIPAPGRTGWWEWEAS